MQHDDNIPIIGQRETAALSAIMGLHIAALVSMAETHKVAIRLLQEKQNNYFAEQTRAKEPVSDIYLELINGQVATHCAAVTQATGQLALLAAMGVEGVPVPMDDSPQGQGGTVQ